MGVREHYKNHLAHFYSWIDGDFHLKQQAFGEFLLQNRLFPTSSKIALDLGSGHGVQSIALQKSGYKVIAIDFNSQLLNELRSNDKSKSIECIEDDIRNFGNYIEIKPELIVCCGDTLSHLDSKKEIEEFIHSCKNALEEKGKLILSFRDYSSELTGNQRFIPVKNDANRILTCFLEYGRDKVTVTDILHERMEKKWHQKVSSYEKVRISTGDITSMVENSGLHIIFNEIDKGMTTLLAS